LLIFLNRADVGNMNRSFVAPLEQRSCKFCSSAFGEKVEEQPVSPDAHLDTPSHNFTPVEQAWPLKKILAATDFSPISTRSIAWAALIAAQCGAALSILHVINVNSRVSSGTAHEFMKTLWEDASAQMQRLASSLSEQMRAETMLSEGLPWEEIVEKSRHFDLLVLGQSRPRTRFKIFSSHTARRVLQYSQCPVLLITSQERLYPDRQVEVASSRGVSAALSGY